MVETARNSKIVRQLTRIDNAQTPDAIAYVVHTELPRGLYGEAFLRGLSKIEDLTEDPRILNQAWRRGRR